MIVYISDAELLPIQQQVALAEKRSATHLSLNLVKKLRRALAREYLRKTISTLEYATLSAKVNGFA